MGGEIDEKYSKHDDRKAVYSSVNPVNLLKNANKFTYIVIVVVNVLIIAITLIIRAIIRKKKRKKA